MKTKALRSRAISSSGRGPTTPTTIKSDKEGGMANAYGISGSSIVGIRLIPISFCLTNGIPFYARKAKVEDLQVLNGTNPAFSFILASYKPFPSILFS